jgi:hypothetical protein
MIWPQSLIKEVAERRAIVFFGSGASRGCTSTTQVSSPPDWHDLLVRLNRSIANNATRNEVNNLINEKKYLDAAEIICTEVNSPDRRILLRDIFLSPQFKQSRIHELIFELDPKISVTTNFDKIYEDYYHRLGAQADFQVCCYNENNILSSLRSPSRVFIKAHGCIDDTDKVVLSRTGFHRARDNFPQFYRVLDSLFMVSTILFVGYSLTDPDIQLVLENAAISVKCAHPHYAFMQAWHNTILKKATEEAYNLQVIEYDNTNGTHAEAIAHLGELVQEVGKYRHSRPQP